MAAVIFTWRVDPYNIFSPLHSDSALTSYKYFEGTRTAKAAHLTDNLFDIVILGSSRSEMGINPRFPLWKNKRVYNASLSGTNFTETYAVFNILMTHQKPKSIILALDFSLFSSHREFSSDFKLSRFNSTSLVDSFFKETLSKQAIEKSFRTLRNASKKQPSKHRLGQRLANSTFEKKIASIGQQNLILKTIWKKLILNKEVYSVGSTSTQKMNLLKELIKQCSKEHVSLKIFISPIHALQLEAFYQIGIWEDYLQWKKDLVVLMQDIHDIKLYDFTSNNLYIYDPIPMEENHSNMKWFWEASHYKEELGNIMIDSIQNTPTSSHKPIGINLLTTDINHELTQQTKNREKYALDNSILVEKIKELVHKAKMAELESL